MTDADQFEAFVRSYQDMVYAVAVRLLGNPAEAEDIAQTVFLKAFQRFDEIGPSLSAAGWLKTVTKNACLNHLSRYRARWSFFSELGRGGGDSESNYAAELVSDRRHRWTWSVRISGNSSRERFRHSRTVSVCRSCCFTSKIPATRKSRISWAFRWAR